MQVKNNIKTGKEKSNLSYKDSCTTKCKDKTHQKCIWALFMENILTVTTTIIAIKLIIAKTHCTSDYISSDCKTSMISIILTIKNTNNINKKH